MNPPPLELTREQVLAFRRRVGALHERLPPGAGSLRLAAWAGLTDSVPRAALLSLHARVAGVGPATWEDPSLVQVWGPRFSAYVVAAPDLPVFSLGRLPDGGAALRRAVELAARLDAFLDGRRMPYGEAGHAMGERPNRLRYAAATGRVVMRWDGARKPVIWTVPAPSLDPLEARLELARRYLHVFAPGTPQGFAGWAGIRPARAHGAFDALAASLVTAKTPIGKGWILAADEPALRAPAGPAAPARLLPSGDSYYLLQGADRALLLPDAEQRRALWTTRVWPGAVLVAGDIVGTWRRADAEVTISAWRHLSPAERHALEAEARSLPLPGLDGPPTVRWAA
ncbi:MAG TPA: crosslink repair DNA glycosylase YcaQ family protein [Candidatus Sulfotelmatobacter sp.]|nr:crosslink repair DNA glycosylase YcaQ family protein [Candidatus Sulfotelmatobacter sp.]